MQIVIDIDDEYVLSDIKNRSLEAESETDKVIINALYNGTSLPKGHGRLIDADAVLSDPFGDTYKDIDVAETIIEADKENAE